MVSTIVKVISPMGIHMRHAQTLIREITPFDCDVILVIDKQEVDAKSIINLMAASIKQDMEIEVRCSGPDEEDALKAVVTLIENGFGESKTL